MGASVFGPGFRQRLELLSRGCAPRNRHAWPRPSGCGRCVRPRLHAYGHCWPRGSCCTARAPIRHEASSSELRTLIRFGDVYRNPALALGQKPAPAVVAGDGPWFGRHQKTHLEFGRNLAPAGHCDEQPAEVGAVAALAIAGPVGISLTNAVAGRLGHRARVFPARTTSAGSGHRGSGACVV